ncbi:response regulator [Ruminococcus sp. AF37-6AT]|nr:response regulator [Ruminococcus sp. AM07-21]RHL42227.1 response regulator [Ruminococcus sp. AF37-6AT]RHP51568.1 response regulator [Ruminococcus sp. AF31-16BH]
MCCIHSGVYGFGIYCFINIKNLLEYILLVLQIYFPGGFFIFSLSSNYFLAIFFAIPEFYLFNFSNPNKFNREIAVAILEEAGLKVDSTENGAIAVEKIANSRSGYYDAVLMDIQMPIMDGYTATRHIRALKNQALARLPIIAISANAFDEDVEASYEAGMNGHLAKPIIVSELFETLGRILFTAE